MMAWRLSSTRHTPLDLQDADYVVAVTLELGKSGNLKWVGKMLDLSKASSFPSFQTIGTWRSYSFVTRLHP